MQIVDTQTRQRGHQVLDRGNTDVALLQHGRHARIAHTIGLRGQVNDLRQIDTVKNNASVGFGRTQGELDPTS
ncbi:hypothetical protein GCM10027565_44580 [Bordetella tumulicola]